MHKQILLLVFANMLFSGSMLAGQITPVEERIAAHVDQEQPRAIALLERAVNINSGTMNFAGVRAVGRLLAPEFDELGFNTEWLDGAEFGRAGHLVAFREGAEAGPKILLIGHLDTVFPVNSTFQKFERIDDNFAKGPGVTDMKGGDVAMIHALRALRAAGVLERLSIKVVMTGDEELSGSPKSLSRAALIDAGKWADFAIGFEDGDGNPETAVIARRGSSGWVLSVTGTRAHSSQVFQPAYGDGAIYEAARILTAFRSELSSLENLTYNPGVILGGTDVEYDSSAKRGTAFGKNNVISSATTVTGDLRAVSLDQWKDAQNMMRAIVADHLPKTDASIEFSTGYPPMPPAEGNYSLLEMFNQASQDLGLGEVRAVNPRNAGAADISFVANDVDMAMDGVGLMGTGGHTLNEVADLRTMASQTKKVAVLLHRLGLVD